MKHVMNKAINLEIHRTINHICQGDSKIVFGSRYEINIHVKLQ